jgi:hypothetical protein
MSGDDDLGWLEEKPDLLEFHRFISGTLQPALDDLERQHEHAAETAVSCRAFASLVDGHFQEQQPGSGSGGQKQHLAPLQAMVDVGERCILQAVVPDPSTVQVDTGVLGLRVEMGLAEARAFVLDRAGVLEDKCKSLERRAEVVAEDIAEARGLLGQLEGLPGT